MDGSSPPLLNPNPMDPLVFLPPSIADQFQASRYLYMATIGAFIWDVLLTAGQDYSLLVHHKLMYPSIIYFVSRISTLAFLITAVVFQAAPVTHCQALLESFASCYVISLTSTSCLFFLRVRAVLQHHTYIIYFFFLLWLANSALSITVPFALTGAHITPTTPYCINTGIKETASATLVLSAIYDTAVYVAISWKLIQSSSTPRRLSVAAATGPGAANINTPLASGSTTVKGSPIRSWSGRNPLSTRGLHGVSKSILQGNQKYYMVTIIGNIVCMILILSRLPPILRAMFNVPNLALENAMATRIYRGVKFHGAERYYEDDDAYALSTFRIGTRTGMTATTMMTADFTSMNTTGRFGRGTADLEGGQGGGDHHRNDTPIPRLGESQSQAQSQTSMGVDGDELSPSDTGSTVNMLGRTRGDVGGGGSFGHVYTGSVSSASTSHHNNRELRL